MKSHKLKYIICTMALIVMVAILSMQPLVRSNLANIYFNIEQRKLPIYSVETEEKKVAISFDAAWGADKTEKIMDLCDEYNVKATFFLVGFWVADYPETANLIAKRNFEIGMHSYTHPDMTKLSSSHQMLELKKNKDIIYSVTGQVAKLFRPPFGAYNNNLINTANELELKTIQWSVDSLDWKGISAGEIASRVCERVKSGSIVLFHNNSDNIINGLKIVLEFLTKNNYSVCPVGELVYPSHYKINQQGVQISTRRNK